MTAQVDIDTVRRCVTESTAKGHTWMMLAVGYRLRREVGPGVIVQVVPGLRGTMRGEHTRPDGTRELVVEVSIAQARAWLRRRDARRRRPPKHTRRQCEALLVSAMPGHAQAADGTRWTCTCGRIYVHVCDESEGCEWSPMP